MAKRRRGREASSSSKSGALSPFSLCKGLITSSSPEGIKIGLGRETEEGGGLGVGERGERVKKK